MKIAAKKNRFRWIILPIAIISFFVISGLLLSIYIENKIDAKIFSLNGKTSSVNVNLFTRTVKIFDLKWTFPQDSSDTNQHVVQLNEIAIKGIRLYELIIHKKIHIQEIRMDSGKIIYNKSIAQNKKTNSDPTYKSFFIQNISITHIQAEIYTDTILSMSATVNTEVKEALVTIDSSNKLHFSLANLDVVTENIDLNRHEGMYGGSVKRIHLNTNSKTIQIDSALLIPNLSKFEFAQYKGEQIGRMNISIPELRVEGVEFEKMLDSSFVASTININTFDLYAFKDKRLPFLRTRRIPLPMESFLKLPFKVKVDSVIIRDSHITIEEFPEKGSASGIITFDALNATLVNLNNRVNETEPQFAHLTASSLLMNTGKIKALFQFPLSGAATYYAEGSIAEMSFTKLNPILQNMANVRVETGYLNKLTFDFTYTDVVSKGILEIDYENLQLASLNATDRSTNEVKSFIMNVFVKNGNSQTASKLRRTGTIDIERDRQRFIFNVWWKSILDGLKSSMLRRQRKKDIAKKK